MQKATKQELQKLKEIVQDVLESSRAARMSDDHLYFLVCQRVAAALGLSVYRLTFAEAFRGHGCGLPRYESVVRMRRMIQRQYPDLLPPDRTRRGREKRRADFVEHARKRGRL